MQYTIADVPVCWSVNGTDSSIVKFTIVTTQGAFLDLGYFDPAGNPVTVTGGTLRTGFCVPSDSLSIDSTGRTFTLNIGDQTVSWNAGAEYYAQLLDVDTAGVDTNYIAYYSPAANGWIMYDNNIDNLTDGYYKESGSFPGFWNLFLGLDSVSVNTYANSNVGIGFNSGISIREGAFNIGIGDRSNELTKDSYSNISIGYSANRRNIEGTTNVTIGSYAGGYNKSSDNIFIGENVAYVDTFSTANTFLGAYANSPDAHRLSKFAIGQIKSDTSIILGYYARTKDKSTAHEIVIGSAIAGNGSHSATLGGTRIDSTFLYGNLNLNGYGSGNKLSGTIGKTGSPYLALFATDGTITEIHRDSVGSGGGGGSGNVTATNGLTETVSGGNTEIKLGGDLTQFTEIDGSNTYGIRFDSLGSFSAFSRGDTRLRSDSTTWGVISNLWFDDLNGLLLETYSSSTLSNTQLFFPRTGQAKFSQTRNFNGINYQNTIQLHQGATTLEAVNVDSSTFTKLQFTPEKIFLDANTVGSDGWVLTLIDSATTEIDYRPLNGIEQDTAAAIDFENLPNKIYQFDFTGKASATVSFTNVKTASVYVIHVLNSNAGDVITWPADCKTETGATLTSTTLAGAGRIFTMYFDGTNYYIK